jgi:hypothetical protein
MGLIRPVTGRIVNLEAAGLYFHQAFDTLVYGRMSHEQFRHFAAGKRRYDKHISL